MWADGHTELRLDDDSLDEDPANPPTPLTHTVSHAADAAMGAPVSEYAWRRLEELATEARQVTVLVHPPGEAGAVLCEVLDENGTRLGAEVGTDTEDAVLNVADVIAGTRKPDSDE